MKWFKHHSDAHMDAKLKRVRKRYGAAGYAIYWYCLELIVGKLSNDNLTFAIEDDSELIGDELGIDSRTVEEIMVFMVNQGLFEQSNSTITCMKIAKHLDERFAKTNEFKNVIRLAKGQSPHPPNCSKIEQKSEDGLKTVERLVTVEEKRREENKSIARFAAPSATDVGEYAKSIGSDIDPDQFCDFYGSKGWKVGAAPMKDWKAAVRNWSRRDANGTGRKGRAAPEAYV